MTRTLKMSVVQYFSSLRSHLLSRLSPNFVNGITCMLIKANEVTECRWLVPHLPADNDP